MKIVYISAGAGGMYCGSCLHDNTLAAALLQTGQDLILVPIYTPLRTDEANVSQRRLFYGGINVYLQQKSALFRHTPWILDRLFDLPALIAWLSKRSGTTRAEQLGALTVSMLRGEHGNQRKELEKLVRWLEDEVRPDVVHLSKFGCVPHAAGQLCGCNDTLFSADRRAARSARGFDGQDTSGSVWHPANCNGPARGEQPGPSTTEPPR